jgi:hypothetical protein
MGIADINAILKPVKKKTKKEKNRTFGKSAWKPIPTLLSEHKPRGRRRRKVHIKRQMTEDKSLIPVSVHDHDDHDDDDYKWWSHSDFEGSICVLFLDTMRPEELRKSTKYMRTFNVPGGFEPATFLIQV